MIHIHQGLIQMLDVDAVKLDYFKKPKFLIRNWTDILSNFKIRTNSFQDKFFVDVVLNKKLGVKPNTYLQPPSHFVITILVKMVKCIYI